MRALGIALFHCFICSCIASEVYYIYSLSFVLTLTLLIRLLTVLQYAVRVVMMMVMISDRRQIF